MSLPSPYAFSLWTTNPHPLSPPLTKYSPWVHSDILPLVPTGAFKAQCLISEFGQHDPWPWDLSSLPPSSTLRLPQQILNTNTWVRRAGKNMSLRDDESPYSYPLHPIKIPIPQEIPPRPLRPYKKPVPKKTAVTGVWEHLGGRHCKSLVAH